MHRPVEDILEIANNPDVPKFLFGSTALDDWTRTHRDLRTGKCKKDSGYYVVIHRSLNPTQRQDFRVLSCWNTGYVVPHSWDVPVPQIDCAGATDNRPNVT